MDILIWQTNMSAKNERGPPLLSWHEIVDKMAGLYNLLISSREEVWQISI